MAFHALHSFVIDRILIVDVEPIVRTTIAAILKDAGYEVKQARNTIEALTVIRAALPALIITNVSLPGISGHEAMLLFKDQAPGVPVLMVSGLPDAEVIRNWKRQTGFDVFPKPFPASDLRAKVREMLSKSKTYGAS